MFRIRDTEVRRGNSEPVLASTTTSPSAITPCGFIGLGHLGRPLAQRIASAGYPLLVWDRDAKRTALFADTAARIASSIAEVGAAAEHVGICVVDDAGVLDVCEQLLPAMQSGSRIAIHSTIGPDTCRALAEKAAKRGIAVIDAPTTGIDGAADAGELAVMIGGEDEAVAQARPIFETFGKLILHMGKAGSGLPAKLIHNGLLAANMALAEHALLAGEAMGIDRTALASLLKFGSGRSYGLELLAGLPRLAAFSHGAELLLKDVHLLSNMVGDHHSGQTLCDTALPFLEKVKCDDQMRDE